MKTPFRVAVAAALVATVPLLVSAETTPAAPAGPAASASARKPADYKSAFEGYRRFEDQKVQSWRDANDKVGRIGGWQAYAREAAADEGVSPVPAGDPGQHKPAAGPSTPPAPAASTPGASPAPVKVPPPVPMPATPASRPHDGHGGHSMHKKP
jgi:hypothetical protein